MEIDFETTPSNNKFGKINTSVKSADPLYDNFPLGKLAVTSPLKLWAEKLVIVDQVTLFPIYTCR